MIRDCFQIEKFGDNPFLLKSVCWREAEQGRNDGKAVDGRGEASKQKWGVGYQGQFNGTWMLQEWAISGNRRAAR